MKINLTKNDSLKIKGIAIILIILHNLYHNIKQYPSQNEFNFTLHKTISLINIFQTNYSDIFRAIFSYFGHYGVELFIFLSAYGLTKKYYHSKAKYNEIVIHNYLKIFFPFLFILIIWVNYKILIVGTSLEYIINSYGVSLFFKLLAVNIPGYALSPVGPWWFYPMIIQFYLVFPILLKLQERFGTQSLVLIMAISLVLLTYINKKILFYNVFGHLPEFCFGIIFAIHSKTIACNKKNIILVLLVFILGQFNLYFWYLSKLTFIYLFISSYTYINNNSNNTTFFSAIGSLSLYAFLINGFLREPFLSFLKHSNNNFIILIVGLIYLTYILILSYLLNSAFKYLKKRLLLKIRAFNIKT